jgi:hypothetical protein
MEEAMAKQKDEEIERVFKVRQMPKDITQYPSENIIQGYLAIDANGAEVRLRKIGERYFETYKGSGRLQRRELEIELSHDQFNTLWPGTEGRSQDRKNPLPSRRRWSKNRAQCISRQSRRSDTCRSRVSPHGRKAQNLGRRIGSARK